MNTTVYLRVARTKRGHYKFSATLKPTREPLRPAATGEALPTIAFGVRLTLPDDAFVVPVVTGVEVPAEVLTVLGRAEAIE
jgi:hypothetical protein